MKLIRRCAEFVQLQYHPLELVPGYGAQISARAATKVCVQTGAHARPPGTGTKCERRLSFIETFSIFLAI